MTDPCKSIKVLDYVQSSCKGCYEKSDVSYFTCQIVFDQIGMSEMPATLEQTIGRPLFLLQNYNLTLPRI